MKIVPSVYIRHIPQAFWSWEMTCSTQTSTASERGSLKFEDKSLPIHRENRTSLTALSQTEKRKGRIYTTSATHNLKGGGLFEPWMKLVWMKKLENKDPLIHILILIQNNFSLLMFLPHCIPHRILVIVLYTSSSVADIQMSGMLCYSLIFTRNHFPITHSMRPIHLLWRGASNGIIAP